MRGTNAKLPPVWLIYITAANLDERIAVCERTGEYQRCTSLFAAAAAHWC